MIYYTDYTLDEYLEDYEQGLEGFGPLAVGHGAPDCDECDLKEEADGDFRHAGCDLCNQGACDVYPAHAQLEGSDEWVHFDICEDCVQLAANGEEPDLPLLEDLAEEIYREFREWILPDVVERYEQDGIPDYPARREAFSNWLDGEVTDRRYPSAVLDVDYPSECIRETDR